MSSASDYGQQFMDLAFEWGKQRLAERKPQPPAGALQTTQQPPRVVGVQMGNARPNSDQSTPSPSPSFDFKNPMVIVGAVLAVGLLVVLLKR